MDSRRRLPGKRVGDEASVLRPGTFQHALVEVEFPESFLSEFRPSHSFNCFSEGLCTLRRFKARKREVRMKGALFRSNAERRKFHLDGCGEFSKFRVGFDAGPKDTRAERAGEEAQPRELHRDWAETRKLDERAASLFQLLWRNLADKFQGDMYAFETYPARVWANFLHPCAELGKPRTNWLGNVQRHEDAHAISAP